MWKPEAVANRFRQIEGYDEGLEIMVVSLSQDKTILTCVL